MLSPVISMLEQGLGFIPNIIGAVFVFIIGLTIAKIVKALIVTALNAVDFGKLLGTAQSGFDKATGGVHLRRPPGRRPGPAGRSCPDRTSGARRSARSARPAGRSAGPGAAGSPHRSGVEGA